MVQLVGASPALETVEGLHSHLHIAPSTQLGLSRQAHSLHAFVDGVGDGEPKVVEDNDEGEEVGDGHEEYHGDVVPLDHGGHCEDGVGGDDCHHAEGPEDLLALELLGATVDCLVLSPPLKIHSDLYYMYQQTSKQSFQKVIPRLLILLNDGLLLSLSLNGLKEGLNNGLPAADVSFAFRNIRLGLILGNPLPFVKDLLLCLLPFGDIYLGYAQGFLLFLYNADHTQ